MYGGRKIMNEWRNFKEGNWCNKIDIRDFIQSNYTPYDKDESFNTFWDYLDTLKDGTDEWRIAMDLGSKYHREGKNPDNYLDEIIAKVNKK